MTITPTQFRAEHYPEFTDPPYTDPMVQKALDDAALEMCEAAWGDFYDNGQAAFAAHKLSLKRMSADTGGVGGAIGPVTSRKVGDVAITMGNLTDNTGTSSSLSSTPYGQEYTRLLNLLGVGMITV